MLQNYYLIVNKKSNMKIHSKAEIVGKTSCIWAKYTIANYRKTDSITDIKCKARKEFNKIVVCNAAWYHRYVHVCT